MSRAQLHVILRRTDDWKDGRRSRHSDDTDVLLRIHHVIGELPTYGYRRVWALLRRQAELDGMPAINAKRVYRIMRQNALLLERKTAVPPSKRAHTGKVAVKESNQRWCSDGFEFRCDNGEKLRVTFALDCCDREALHWAVTTGGFDSETVQDVMLGAVERRFGNELPASPVEWLTDNGSCYRANETRQFARMLGLEPKNTAVRSPESNGIAESFVKTIKRDYISIMPKPDGLTAAKNLAEAFEHYNEWHPHSALGYRSPREYLRQQASNGLSDNRCLEIMAGKVFAFSCNVDGGSSIGAGTTSVYVNLDPVIQPGQNLVVDLSQHISCWNDYGGWYDTDHINLVQGSAFAGSLQSYKGSLYWNNVTYPFPLTTNTNVLDIGDKTPMPLPLKLYITPVGAAGGVVIKAGEVIARIHMYKIATLGSGNPRNFTWNIISNNNVVMPTGGCTVDSRNVTVDLPDFPGSAEIPLGVYCSSEQKLSFYLSGATTDSSRQVFANTAPDATKASGVGVTLMRNGKILATGENVSLGTVNKSKVPLGLSATYGQTGNKVSAGTVQSVIGVTFIYE
ncbi:hypothetical protein VEE56_22060 [Escherichia coli]|nr:hypothetical protein VEE56_22060 [Escherichia coli]